MTFINSDKAVSEVIGHVIMLGMTVMGISLISVVGIPAIYDMQDMANVRNAEQAFTVLDSRVSAVVLGSSPIQFIEINLGGGTLTVEPNETSESYIQVNHNASESDPDLTVPMGKIKYQLGDRIVAYEGGGIWSKYPSGNSIMLSPPEFHYNGVTLTLPAINISGTSSVGGSGSAIVKLVKGSDPIVIKYPDTIRDPNWTNPVSSSGDGKVYVNITSDFSDAWADYARSLGYTIVSEDGANNTVSIELTIVPTTMGSSTSITNPITMRGLDTTEEPLGNFSFILKDVDSNFNWQLTAISGTKTLIFYLKKTGDGLDLSIGYKDTGLGYPEKYSAEIWKKEGAFPVTDSTANVNLLNQSINLSYESVNVGATSGDCTKIKTGDFNSTTFTWPTNDVQSLYNITQHYLWKMAQVGDISFTLCSPTGNQGPDDSSTMLINYTASGALTYLHISDNRVDVGIS